MNSNVTIEEFNTKFKMTQQISDSIEFEYCPVLTKVTKSFKIKNFSKKDIEFSFSENFFKIEPSSSKIKPSEIAIINISCYSESARVIIAKTTWRVSEQPDLVIKICAIFKFPFLHFETEVLDFGCVTIGHQVIINGYFRIHHWCL